MLQDAVPNIKTRKVEIGRPCQKPYAQETRGLPNMCWAVFKQKQVQSALHALTLLRMWVKNLYAHTHLTMKVEIYDSVLDQVYVCASSELHDVFHHV
jgi:hypothetical protein